MNRNATGWWLLLPYLLVTTVFFLWPFIDAVVLAFHQTNGPRSRVFVGLDNFRFVLGDPDFHRAVLNTGVFAVASLLIQIPLALGLALLLHGNRNRLFPWVRLVLFSPHLVGPVFVGIIFAVLFAPQYGLINQGIHALTGSGLDRRWLGDPALVMPALVLTNLWMYTGFNMVYFLAALQNVDRTLVEAARIDGASPWQVFRHVTWPAIRPVTAFVVITCTIGSFQLFELPYTLLKGNGPSNSGLTVVGYLYQNAFNAGDLGTGAAVGWLLALMIFILAVIQIRMGSRR